MAITKDEMIEALQKASKLGYFGGMGSGPTGATGTTEASTSAAKFSKELGNASDFLKGFGSATLQAGSAVAIGGARLSDVTQALSAGFKGLGTSGNLLGTALSEGATALNYLGKNIDENVDTFRKLSDTGLAFGNDIMAMKEQASGARLSIAEFSEVMQKNNATMIGFGATSAASAKQLSKMSDEFFKSGLGEQLRGMGYTTKELNDVLAVSISGQKIKDLNEKGVSARALSAASSLAFEMDAIAKITGKSKEAQLDELRKTQADGQIIAARNLMISEGGAKTAEAFQAVSTTAALGGEEMKKLTLAYLTGAVLSQEQMQTFALLSDGARESLDAAKEATKRGGDNDIAIAKQKTQMFLAQSALDIRTMDRSQMIATGQFETQTRITGQTEKLATALQFATKELGPNADAAQVAALGLKKLGEEIAIEQKAGGKDDPNAAAGASITRFAIDMESRGRDLTNVLYNQVTKPLSTDIANTIVKISEKLKLSDAMLIQREIGDPMKKGYDKARINREVIETADKKGGAMEGAHPANKAFLEFNKLITGTHVQTDATLKVLQKIADDQSKTTGKTVTAKDVAVTAVNTPGAMADIVKQINKELANNPENKPPITNPPVITNDPKDVRSMEGLGKGIETLGSLFKTGTAKVQVVDGVKVKVTEVEANAGGGIVDKPSLRIVGEAGPEAIFNQSQLENYTAKVMGSAAGAMPKTEAPKLDVSGISKSISTSISSVSGGGSTTNRRVQSDDSKAAEKELASVQEQMQAERTVLRQKLKDTIGDGSKSGGNAVAKEMRIGDESKAIADKYNAIMEPLKKQINAGISSETVREEANAETTKMVTEQIAITKTGNSTLADMYKDSSKDKLATAKKDTESLDDMYKSKSKDKLATAKKDAESLDDMYKDDSKAKLDLAKQRNEALFKAAELAKDVVGTSVKDMSDSVFESMIPKGAKIEDYYEDMNGKLQSHSLDTVAKLEKLAKDSANTIITEEEAIVEARVAIKKTEKQMAAAESLGIDSSPFKKSLQAKQDALSKLLPTPDTTALPTAKESPKPTTASLLDLPAKIMPATLKSESTLDVKSAIPDMSKTLTSLVAGMPKLEVPKLEVPKLEVPKLEVPKLEVPKLEVPKLEVPKLEVPNMSKTFEGLTTELPSMFKSMTADLPSMFKSMTADLPKPESILDIKSEIPDMSKTFESLTAGMPEMFKSMTADLPGMFKSMTADLPGMFKSMSADLPGMFKSMSAGMPEMFKSISTSISSVTGPGSTSIKQPQVEVKPKEPEKLITNKPDESAQPQVEVKPKEPERLITNKPGESAQAQADAAPKSKSMSTSDMMAGGLTLGANGMPIMKSIDTVKNSIPAKPADADTDRENAKFKRAAEEKKAEAEKMAEKKPDTKAATKESTLSDVVAQLNSLNKQMGQLIAVSEEGHKSTTKAAKSTAGNIYAR